MAETKYTKGLIAPKIKDPAEDRIDFYNQRRALEMSPAEGTGQLNQTLVADVPREKLDKLQSAPLQNADDAMANISKLRAEKEAQKAAALGAAPVENVYDAAEMKRQFIEKNKTPNWKKALKPGLGALAGVALMSSLPDEAMASPVVQTGMRALDEGDPTSFLIPGNVGDADAERQMLAEHNARVNYDNSPARAARLAALAKLGR